MKQIVVAVVLFACLLCGCGEAPPADEVTRPTTVDRTDPWEVAHAWVRGWCAGEGAHREYAFEAIPEPEAGLGSDNKGLPQGTPVAAFVSASSGIGGKPNERQLGFDLDDYTLRVGPGGRLRSIVSAKNARAVRYTIEVRLEDDSVHHVTLLLRPEGSFERHVSATPDTRWLVVR